MIIVGLTGGIASGKSFVVDYLKKLKIPTHESDRVVGNIYSNPTTGFLKHLELCDLKTAINKKKINKQKIRDEIFKNKNKKEVLEKFLHKKVKEKRNDFIKKNKNKKIIFIEIPLLFENNLNKEFDYICTTIAPIQLRKDRAIKRKYMSAKIFNLILKNQTIDSLRKKQSNFIINTFGNKNKTYIQINKMLYDILKETK